MILTEVPLLIESPGQADHHWLSRSDRDYNELLRGIPGHGDFHNRWMEPGDEQRTIVPSLPSTANLRRNDFYENSAALVEKGDNIRLNDIRFSYSLSRQQIKNLPFSGLELYTYANNLGLIWKASDDPLDPDFQSARALRSISFGLRVDF